MAIFGGKKNLPAKAGDVKEKKTPAKTETKSVATSAARVAPTGYSHVLLAPRITEKAAILSDASVYVFSVTKDSTKSQIALAIAELFKVTPRKVRVVNTKGTRVTTRVTGKKGSTKGHKKAYVYLKKGEKIELA
jgi:large subunit ribosomal protein L23